LLTAGLKMAGREHRSKNVCQRKSHLSMPFLRDRPCLLGSKKRKSDERM
jgi:hypothetical protein